MLIEIKSNQNPEPKDEKRFELKPEERPSRLPTYIALMIVGIAAYIRSIGFAIARVPEHAPNRAGPDHSPSAPDEQAVAQLNLVAPEVDETETGSIGDAEGPGNSIHQGPEWPGRFQAPDFPQLHFVEPSFFTPNIRPFVPVTVFYGPVNDNSRTGAGTTIVPQRGGDPVIPINRDRRDGDGKKDDGDSADNDDDDDDDDDDDGENSPGNRAPTVMGPVRLNDVFAGQVVLIGLIHLLRGASDPDGDELSIEGLVALGARLIATVGGWLLETRPGMTGPVTVTYRITDGEAWIPQTANLAIVRKQFEYGDGDDIIIGSPFDDDIYAGGGNNIIDALEGNDHVEGGVGDDYINGGPGDDVLMGGLGNDVIFGGAGNDIISGGAGNDRLFGDDGDDTIFGDAGNDYIEGGNGNDHLDGGEGDDFIDGGDGADRVIGGEGNDHLIGGNGNDFIEGGAGNDTLRGGTGNDVLADGEGDDIVYGDEGDDMLVAGAGDDAMFGGEGYDTLDLSAAEEGLVVDMIGGKSYSGELGTDSFCEIEEVRSGAGNDMFIIGGSAVVVSGGKGRNTFIFEVTDINPSVSDKVVHKILDFVVGDKVRVRDYELDRDTNDLSEDFFKALYGDDSDDWLRSDIPVLVRHELINEESWTVIMADINGDSLYDLAINIQGAFLVPTTFSPESY